VQEALENGAKLTRICACVSAAVAVGGAAAAAAVAAAEAAAAAVVVVGSSARGGNCVLYSEIEGSARPLTDSGVQDGVRPDSDGVRSASPATPLTHIPPTRGGTALSGGGGGARGWHLRGWFSSADEERRWGGR
jgi:hypothetical protein